MTKMLHDAQVALDLLAAMPEVDDEGAVVAAAAAPAQANIKVDQEGGFDILCAEEDMRPSAKGSCGRRNYVFKFAPPWFV